MICEQFRSSDSAAVVNLLGRVFSAAEPPAVAVGLTQLDVERFVGFLCPKAAIDGLTVIARTPDANRVVGVLLTDDFAVSPELDLRDISEKFLPILTMLDGLDEEYRLGRSIVPGQYLHLFMLGVDPTFVGCGIAQCLVAACLETGRQKGYTHAVTEATGVVSQHVFRKLGFVDRLRAPYQDYRYDGRAVFTSIRGHDATVLMDRTIT
jgi:ribosomal protein S18 acetylase RimI-like enzyme